MNIIITGASKGIGFDTALALAEKRDNNVIALSRDKSGLARLAQAAADKGYNNIKTYPTDLLNLTAKGVEEIVAGHQRIDVLLNNAGILINKPFIESTVEDWQSVFNTNLFATVNLVQLLLPYMSHGELSHIVNIGSMGGFTGTSKFKGLSAYSASKAALGNLTETLAEELKEYRIHVNCLALGAVNTSMLQDAFPGYKAPVESSDMAAFIAFFSQQAHNFINGKILPISVTTP
ncbi:MAG TPA: SDR family oxidoreductase [Flavipsychrobacter sp.]